MEGSEGGSNELLKSKYNLHKAPEVGIAAKRTLARTGEKVPQDPLLRIQNYLNRFHEISGREDPKDREHGLDAAKRLLSRKYVIKPAEIPESYFENQKRIIRERGQGADLEGVDWNDLKRQNTEAIIADQRSSLDKWVDYLSSADAPYPDALKYFTLRSILNMSEYDKEKKMYPQRSKGTTKPFPDLNREALAYVLDAVEKKYQAQRPEENDPEFEKLLQGENFAKLYGFAIEKVTPASAEALSNTQVKWVKYTQGSDHMLLVKSLQGHGTGWCTAGESTARAQLNGGDFYVAYSPDQDGQPTIPRVAIRMEKNRIAEVRGIAAEQNLDSGVVAEVDKKLREFPDGPSYQKKVEDMRKLTGIEQKAKDGEELTGQDLAFLYEIDSVIKGFGYRKDPRIAELRAQRNSKEDMAVVFGWREDQIARDIGDISGDTKAYLGKLKPGIFDKLPQQIEHVYTSFPEGKIKRQTLEIGGKKAKLLIRELEQAGINIDPGAEDMLKSPDFTTLSKPVSLEIVKLRVQDLSQNALYTTPTTDEIYQAAKALGLELCPPEVGPCLRLEDKNQPMGEQYKIAMKQIKNRYDLPSVFSLGCNGDRMWLNSRWAFPRNTHETEPEDEFVFVHRKEEIVTQKLGLFDRFFKR